MTLDLGGYEYFKSGLGHISVDLDRVGGGVTRLVWQLPDPNINIWKASGFLVLTM